jgi:addiction module antidote protein, HigA family
MSIRREDIDTIDLSDIITGEKIPPTHPGESLREILEELGLSQSKFAKLIGVSPMRVSHIVNGMRSITADFSLRLGKVFGQSPDFWLRLQALYDLEVAERQPSLNLDKIKRLNIADLHIQSLR